MLTLAKQMRTFEYDPSGKFRSWLKTVAHRAWCDFRDRRKRGGTTLGDGSTIEELLTAEAEADFLERIEAEFRRELLEIAMDRARPRVKPHTWEAFRHHPVGPDN